MNVYELLSSGLDSTARIHLPLWKHKTRIGLFGFRIVDCSLVVPS